MFSCWNFGPGPFFSLSPFEYLWTPEYSTMVGNGIFVNKFKIILMMRDVTEVIVMLGGRKDGVIIC